MVLLTIQGRLLELYIERADPNRERCGVDEFRCGQWSKLAFLYESRYWTGWPESAVAEGASEFGDWGNGSLKITP